MNSKPSIKILVAYHKPSALFKDEVLTPIHLGRALSKEAHKDGKVSDEDFAWLCENMIGDDTGENISHLNRYFNEMTGIYWAWKNYDKLGNPDYIGFMSYRCLFYLRKRDADNSPIGVGKHQLPYYNFNNFSDFYWSDKDTQEILNLIKGYDYITNLPAINRQNVEEQYKNTDSLSVGHIPEDIETLKSIIAQDFPRYKQNFENYLAGFENYFSNSFIMKKELFFEYCEFIFPILFKYHQSIDYTHRNLEQSRMFVSERLTGAFYQFLKFRNLNFKEIPLILVENPILTPKQIIPAFMDNNNIPIALSVNKHYLPYLCVALSSIIKNSNPNHYYDITILHTDVPVILQERFNYLKQENISIRFINISSLLGRISIKEQGLFYTSGHLDLSTYFRFFIPRLYCQYQKIIYLDVDMVVLEDLSKLYAINLENKTLGATLDVGQLYDTILYPKQKKYVREKLKIHEENYFQAGLLVYNIPKCLEINFEKLCLDKLKELKNPTFHDQDVLNSVFENQIKFLNLTWNLTWDMHVLRTNGLKCLPINLYNTYQKAQKNPCIVHYCTHIKPWNSPHLPLADLWWNYARKTPFYEEMLIGIGISTKKFGAEIRVKNYLSYKLGFAMINAKDPLRALALPFTLVALIIQHKRDRQIYKAISRVNPDLALLPLWCYADYEKALKTKKHLSYRLGEVMLKNPFTFVFKIPRIYKDYTKGKKK